MSVIEVHGHVEDLFLPVLKAFRANFAEHGEAGASFAVTIEGRIAVDIWAGSVDEAAQRSWERDTLVNVFSTTKAMTALCAHLLIDRGLLDVDAPVANYWPEFAQGGKESMPVRYLLDHRAGLAMPSRAHWKTPVTEWDEICALQAEAVPMHDPGIMPIYHAATFGYLVGEVVRRVSGLSLGNFFRRQVAEPLGVDFHIGLPESEQDRVAELLAPVGGWEALPGLDSDVADPVRRLLSAVRWMARMANDRAWRAAEVPSANGQGNARSIATVFGALANNGAWQGVQLISAEAVRLMATRSPSAPVLAQWPGGVDAAWTLGFMPNWGAMFGPSPGAFGHTGFGGSFGMCDPVNRISVGYAMNRMGRDWQTDIRAAKLVASVYASLPELSAADGAT